MEGLNNHEIPKKKLDTEGLTEYMEDRDSSAFDEHFLTELKTIGLSQESIDSIGILEQTSIDKDEQNGVAQAVKLKIKVNGHIIEVINTRPVRNQVWVNGEKIDGSENIEKLFRLADLVHGLKGHDFFENQRKNEEKIMNGIFR